MIILPFPAKPPLSGTPVSGAQDPYMDNLPPIFLGFGGHGWPQNPPQNRRKDRKKSNGF